MRGRMTAKRRLDILGFNCHRDASIGKKPVIDTPCLPHVERLTVHHGTRRKKAQESNLSETAKSDVAWLTFPPCERSLPVNMWLYHQRQPDIEIREAQ